MNAVLHLVNYAVNTGLIADCERTWALNTILDVLKADALPDLELNENAGLAETLDILCDYAYGKGLIPENTVTYRDLFDTELMGRLTPRPAEVISRFETLYAESPKAATDWYYAFSQNVNYIRRERHTGEVSRSFYIDGIDDANIHAEFKDGVLQVNLPKTADTPARKQIEIH